MDKIKSPLNARNLLKKMYKIENNAINNNYIYPEKNNISQINYLPLKRNLKIDKKTIDISSYVMDNSIQMNQILYGNYNSFINYDKKNNSKELNLDIYSNHMNIINPKHFRDNNMESVEWMYLNGLSKNESSNKEIFNKKLNLNIRAPNCYNFQNAIKKKIKFPSLFISNNKKLIRTDKSKSTINRNKIIINAKEKQKIEKQNLKEENKINTFIRKRKLLENYFLSLTGTHNGQKKINQDCSLFLPTINDCENISLYGILNGHGAYGDKLVKEISEFFKDYFTKKITFNKMNKDNSLKLSLSMNNSKKNEILPFNYNQKNIYKIRKLKSINDKYNQRINETHQILCGNNFSKIYDSFNEIDNILHEKYNENKKCDDSGTSLNFVIIFNSKIDTNKIISVNLGNTKSILITDEKKIKELNISHTPCIKEERIRIERHGGVIDRIDWLKVGPLRVWFKGKKYPGLTITRSLGDFEAIPLGIIPLPDIKEYDIDEEKIKILVIATNGIWEFLTNDKIMDITWQYYESKDTQGATKKILETAEKLWKIKNPNNIPDLTASVFFFK